MRKFFLAILALFVASGAFAQTTNGGSAAPKLQLQRTNPAVAAKDQLQYGQAKIDPDAISKAYAASLKGNAELYFKDGDIRYEAKDWLDPNDKFFTRTFRWEVGGSPKANGVVWQVSSRPFSPDMSLSANPLEPVGLMRSGFIAGAKGSFDVDFADLAIEAGLREKPKTATLQSATDLARTGGLKLKGAPEEKSDKPTLKLAPGVLQKKTKPKSAPAQAAAAGQLKRADAALAGYIAAGGTKTFYVRALPVIGDASFQRVAGFSSEIGEIVYGKRPPPKDAFEGFEWVEKEIPNIELASFTYTPWYADEHWPAGCTVYRGGGNDYFNPLEFLMDAWDWVSTAYADIKASVIDLASGFLPFVPREVFEVALDAALAAAGMPPTLPNIDQMMEEGAGYLAEQATGAVMGPVGSAMTEELAGELFKDAAADMIAQMTAEELHDAVQDEMESRLKSELQSSARSARAEIEGKADDMYCQTREYMPTLRLTLKNRSNKRYRDVTVRIGETAGTFESHELKVTLKPYERYDLVLPMYPDFWKLAGTYQVTPAEARQKYRTAYGETPTQFYVYGPSALKCFETEYGYVMECRAAPASDPRPLRFKSPSLMLTDAYKK